jgi:hypothetical protein
MVREFLNHPHKIAGILMCKSMSLDVTELLGPKDGYAGIN